MNFKKQLNRPSERASLANLTGQICWPSSIFLEKFRLCAAPGCLPQPQTLPIPHDCSFQSFFAVPHCPNIHWVKTIESQVSVSLLITVERYNLQVVFESKHPTFDSSHSSRINRAFRSTDLQGSNVSDGRKYRLAIKICFNVQPTKRPQSRFCCSVIGACLKEVKGSGASPQLGSNW